MLWLIQSSGQVKAVLDTTQKVTKLPERTAQHRRILAWR